MAIDIIKNQPVAFDPEIDSCNDFDLRTYCQMANFTDDISLVWNAALVGEDLMGDCASFDDECCFDAGGGESECPVTTSYWQVVAGAAWSVPTTPGDGFFCSDGGGTAAYPDILTELGTYKVVVEIAGFPNDIDNTGTFTVILGNAQGDVTPAVAGTYTYYLTPTNITGGNTGIKIQSNNGVFCLTYVSVQQICTDYSIYIVDMNDNIVKSFDYTLYGVMTQIEGQFYFQSNWSDFGIVAGCYRICVINNCDQLIQNPSFDEDTDGDADVDINDVLVDWIIDGFGMTFSSNKICHDGSGDAGSISACPLLLNNTTYVLKYTIEVGAGFITTFKITINGVVVVLKNTATMGIGTFTFTTLFTTGSGDFTCPNVVVDFGIFFNGCLHSIYITPYGSDCSECYDLGTHDCTKLLSWTNDDDGFGIAYSQIALTHYMRVAAIIHSPRYPETIDRFAFSDGTRKILYADGEKIWKLLIDYIPEYMHDAIATGKKHDHFYIDGVEYICSSENYEPEWRERQKLLFAQSTIEVQKVTQQTLNQNI